MLGIFEVQFVLPLDDGVKLTGDSPLGHLSADLYHLGHTI